MNTMIRDEIMKRETSQYTSLVSQTMDTSHYSGSLYCDVHTPELRVRHKDVGMPAHIQEKVLLVMM